MTELNYQKGRSAIETGQYQEAVFHFTKSLSVESSSATFHNRAFAYMNLGKKELAKNDYESVIRITNEYLAGADKNDKEYIDLCLRDIIDAKATIAHVEMENENFSVVEKMSNEIIDLNNSMFDSSILREDLHVSNFYSNRGMVEFNLDRIEDATRDFAVAFIESPSEEKKNEILMFAEMTGLLGKVKQYATIYSNSKRHEKSEDKIFILFKALGLDIKVPVTIVDDLTYNFPIPRPIPKENYLSESDYTMNVSKQQFTEDIKFQTPKSLNDIPSSLEGELEAIAFESLFLIIEKHIHQFGRILPTDLDSYIGQNILLFNAILKAQGRPTLDKKEQQERFTKFNYMAFGALPENLKNIYMTPF